VCTQEEFPGRSPILKLLLTWRFFGDELPKKKVYPIDEDKQGGTSDGGMNKRNKITMESFTWYHYAIRLHSTILLKALDGSRG
jgi:hypothetical protein